jgi:UDP-N-acetylglucosamine--N-acetylmuramyl-(pentapeptide) pyrophosphoryl-undecaprenol N-acetylglucosamine transferase
MWCRRRWQDLTHCVRLAVMQQCRAEDLPRVRAAYDAAGIAAELAAFFPDVADRLAAARLVIARAGARPLPNWRWPDGDPGAAAWRDRRPPAANARALADARAVSVVASAISRPGIAERSPHCPPRRHAGPRGVRRATCCADATTRLADLVET